MFISQHTRFWYFFQIPLVNTHANVTCNLNVALIPHLNFALRPTLKIFLFPLALPCFTGMGVVGNLFFLTKNLKLDTH